MSLAGETEWIDLVSEQWRRCSNSGKKSTFSPRRAAARSQQTAAQTALGQERGREVAIFMTLHNRLTGRRTAWYTQRWPSSAHIALGLNYNASCAFDCGHTQSIVLFRRVPSADVAVVDGQHTRSQFSFAGFSHVVVSGHRFIVDASEMMWYTPRTGESGWAQEVV